MAELAHIGVTGLAVMGRNLARNFARHGHRVAIHNRSWAKTESLMAEAGHEGEFVPSESMADFVASLERPRRVLIMVKAGPSTDAVIEELVPLLEDGDIIIDARTTCGRRGCTSSAQGFPAAKKAPSMGRRSCRVGRGSPTSLWVRSWSPSRPRSRERRAAPTSDLTEPDIS